MQKSSSAQKQHNKPAPRRPQAPETASQPLNRRQQLQSNPSPIVQSGRQDDTCSGPRDERALGAPGCIGSWSVGFSFVSVDPERERRLRNNPPSSTSRPHTPSPSPWQPEARAWPVLFRRKARARAQVSAQLANERPGANNANLGGAERWKREFRARDNGVGTVIPSLGPSSCIQYCSSPVQLVRSLTLFLSSIYLPACLPAYLSTCSPARSLSLAELLGSVTTTTTIRARAPNWKSQSILFSRCDASSRAGPANNGCSSGPKAPARPQTAKLRAHSQQDTRSTRQSIALAEAPSTSSETRSPPSPARWPPQTAS